MPTVASILTTTYSVKWLSDICEYSASAAKEVFSRHFSIGIYLDSFLDFRADRLAAGKNNSDSPRLETRIPSPARRNLSGTRPGFVQESRLSRHVSLKRPNGSPTKNPFFTLGSGGNKGFRLKRLVGLYQRFPNTRTDTVTKRLRPPGPIKERSSTSRIRLFSPGIKGSKTCALKPSVYGSTHHWESTRDSSSTVPNRGHKGRYTLPA